MSLDACFRLCRRAKAGCAVKDNTPLIQPSFFISQPDVDSYVMSDQQSAGVPVTVQVSYTFIPIVPSLV